MEYFLWGVFQKEDFGLSEAKIIAKAIHTPNIYAYKCNARSTDTFKRISHKKDENCLLEAVRKIPKIKAK